MSSKTVTQVFKILIQSGDINIIVLRGFYFNRYVQLKSTFSDRKISAVETETHLGR